MQFHSDDERTNRKTKANACMICIRNTFLWNVCNDLGLPKCAIGMSHETCTDQYYHARLNDTKKMSKQCQIQSMDISIGNGWGFSDGWNGREREMEIIVHIRILFILAEYEKCIQIAQIFYPFQDSSVLYKLRFTVINKSIGSHWIWGCSYIVWDWSPSEWRISWYKME